MSNQLWSVGRCFLVSIYPKSISSIESCTSSLLRRFLLFLARHSFSFLIVSSRRFSQASANLPKEISTFVDTPGLSWRDIYPGTVPPRRTFSIESQALFVPNIVLRIFAKCKHVISWVGYPNTTENVLEPAMGTALYSSNGGFAWHQTFTFHLSM